MDNSARKRARGHSLSDNPGIRSFPAVTGNLFSAYYPSSEYHRVFKKKAPAEDFDLPQGPKCQGSKDPKGQRILASEDQCYLLTAAKRPPEPHPPLHQSRSRLRLSASL
mgnify:CR=1 FL=1